MTDLPCFRCGKLTVAAAVGSKIRNGSIHYCSRKCASASTQKPTPKNEMPEFLKGLFK